MRYIKKSFYVNFNSKKRVNQYVKERFLIYYFYSAFTTSAGF